MLGADAAAVAVLDSLRRPGAARTGSREQTSRADYFALPVQGGSAYTAAFGVVRDTAFPMTALPETSLAGSQVSEWQDETPAM
jgi:hypothetical protein